MSWKVFSGKLYHQEATAFSKKEAEAKADKFREKGLLARISNAYGMWFIYTRKRGKK